MVALDVCPAGRPELNESESLQVLWVFFKESLDSPESFHQPFGVVHSVHADSKENYFRSQLFQNGCAALKVRPSAPHFLRPFWICNANRMRPHGCEVMVSIDDEPVPFNAGLDCVIDRLQEIIAMRLDMES